MRCHEATVDIVEEFTDSEYKMACCLVGWSAVTIRSKSGNKNGGKMCREVDRAS